MTSCKGLGDCLLNFDEYDLQNRTNQKQKNKTYVPGGLNERICSDPSGFNERVERHASVIQEAFASLFVALSVTECYSS